MAKTILVPTDFEEPSIRALAVAKELAQKLGAEVVLLHVCQLPVFGYPGFEPAVLPALQTELLAAATKAVDDLAEQHAVRGIVREGDAASEILAAAKQLDPEMIAMGTHGRKGLAHVLLGSVAEKVVRRSLVPVLTVRTPV